MMIRVLAGLGTAAVLAILGGTLLRSRRFGWKEQFSKDTAFAREFRLKMQRRMPPANPQLTIPIGSLPPMLPPAARHLTHSQPEPALQAEAADETPAPAPTHPNPAEMARQAHAADLVAQERLAACIALVRQGSLAQAEIDLLCLIQDDAQHAQAWFWLGWVYARGGRIPAAHNCFEHAQHYHHPEAARALAWCQENGRVNGLHGVVAM